MTTWVLLSSLDAPSAGVFDFPSLSLSSYSAIMVVGAGITVTTDGTDLQLTVYESGSEITGGTSYRWAMHVNASSGTGNTDADNASSNLVFVSNDAGWDVGNAAGEGIGFLVTFDAPAVASLERRGDFEMAATAPDSTVMGADGVFVQNGTAAMDGIKVQGSSALTAGKVRVLGLA